MYSQRFLLFALLNTFIHIHKFDYNHNLHVIEAFLMGCKSLMEFTSQYSIIKVQKLYIVIINEIITKNKNEQDKS